MKAICERFREFILSHRLYEVELHFDGYLSTYDLLRNAA